MNLFCCHVSRLGENSKTATLKLSAVVSGLKIELPLDASQKDLCKSVKCPIVSGETYEAILKLTIPSVVPSVSIINNALSIIAINL